MSTPPRVLVAAVGSVLRGDDGVGAAVLGSVRGRLGQAEVLGPLGSPLDLLGTWDGAALAVVVDALGPAAGREADPGSEPGTVHVVELGADGWERGADDPSPRASSHGIGVVEVLVLSRVLGTAPQRVVLVGVAGADFAPRAGLSPPVARAVGRAGQRVLEVARGTIGPGRPD